jgi:hypothetical protein
MRSVVTLPIPALAAGLCCLFASCAFAQDERCGAGKDLVVQALEQIKTGADSEVEDGLQLLKHANEICPSLGDGWYYRSLFERRLGRTDKAKYALSKAKLFDSEKMAEGANPFVLATTPISGDTANHPVREKWALVVGIKTFPHLAAQYQLHYASKDAKDFSDLLLDPRVGRFKPSNVHALDQGEVTQRQLKQELNWLARSAQEDDLVVIFLATHGTPRQIDTADVNYIATSDTEVDTPDNLFSTAMPMVELSDIVRTRIKAKRTAIFLDMCHSGAAAGTLKERASASFADSSAGPNSLERIRQGIGRTIITSSAADEVSAEGAPFQNGYFTHFLMDGLRQNNGMNSLVQVYEYLKEKLPKAAMEIRKRQTPEIARSDIGAEIILGAPAGEQATTVAGMRKMEERFRPEGLGVQ